MTNSQERKILLARDHIREARQYLDTVMYRMEPPLNDSEYNRIRLAYELLCQANDKL